MDKHYCVYCGRYVAKLDKNESCIDCKSYVESRAYVKIYCPFCGYLHNDPKCTYCTKCLKTFDNKNKGDNMNSIPKAIVKLFPKTEDAVIVDEYFHDAFNNNRIMGILAKGKEKEILAAAHHLDNEKRAKMYRK